MVILLAATSAFTASTPVTTKTNHARMISININNFDFFFSSFGEQRQNERQKYEQSETFERASISDDFIGAALAMHVDFQDHSNGTFLIVLLLLCDGISFLLLLLLLRFIIAVVVVVFIIAVVVLLLL